MHNITSGCHLLCNQSATVCERIRKRVVRTERIVVAETYSFLRDGVSACFLTGHPSRMAAK